MSIIGKVPVDLRPQVSGMMAAAINMDRGRPLGYGVIPVPGGRYIMEETRRPPVANWTDGPSVATAEAPENGSKTKTPARALWPDLA
jgi:hypothetical protein